MFIKHLWHVLTGQIHKIETNPITQYRFHLFFTWFWFLMMPVIWTVVPHNSAMARVELGIFEVSLWANFVSHMTAVGSAVAAIYAAGLQSYFAHNHSIVLPLLKFIARLFGKPIQTKPFANPNYKINNDVVAVPAEQTRPTFDF